MLVAVIWHMQSALLAGQGMCNVSIASSTPAAAASSPPPPPPAAAAAAAAAADAGALQQ